jgi:prolipoprotein diacylglyceryltransferase
LTYINEPLKCRVMQSNFSLDITNGGLLYQVFYTAAFLIAYVILVYQGYRRKFPLVVWILILASIRLAVVIGTKLFSWTPAEWQFMIENNTLLPVTKKTMYGGFLLGVVAYLIVSRILRFRHSAWDTVAYALPAAVAVQSVGCFFYGCCFGTPSALPWAVRYPVMSLAHYHQFESGLIHYGDTLSLPVHPVQLYETAGALLVLLLVFLFRNRWKAKGSLLLSSLVFFSVIRFIVDFFRDPLSNKTGGEMFIGLKVVQWQYIAFAVLMLLILVWREKKGIQAKEAPRSDVPSLSTQAGILLSLLLIFILLRNWFTLPEAIALNIALIPALVFTGAYVYKRHSTLRIRLAYAALLPLSLFLMSQTLPLQQGDTTNVNQQKSYHTISGGFSTGNYTTERTLFSGSGCSRVRDTKYYHQQYTSGTIGYSMTRMSSDMKAVIRYGGSITAGSFTVIPELSGEEMKKPLVDLSGFISIDAKWIGAGIGLHGGNIYYNRGDSFSESTDINTSHFWTPVFPSAYFRVGPERIFFADLHIADNFPSSSPGLAFMTGVGSGFGLRNGFKVRTGFEFLDETTFYVSAYIPIADKLVLEPLYVWSSIYDPVYDYPENQISVGLSYRFGHK